MDLTPIQHQQASETCDKLLSLWKTHAPTQSLSPTNAFIAIGLLNLPAPATYHLLKTRARRQAISSWPESWNARWIAHYFPDKTPSLQADHIASHVRSATQALTSRLALSHLTLSRNRYWTLLTSNFTHFNLSHLLGNLLALNAVGPACADVPGMSAAHVFGIALLTSLATSAQALYRFSDVWGWRMCGFSAVVCAYTSFGALGAPAALPDEEGNLPLQAKSLWTVAAMQVAGDVVAAVRARRGGPVARGEAVDYVGHLVGYACGAAYYAFFLWWNSRENGLEGGEEMLEEREASAVGEILRAREQSAAPSVKESESVSESEGWKEEASTWEAIAQAQEQSAPSFAKESEDWQEVADKLGYSEETQT